MPLKRVPTIMKKISRKRRWPGDPNPKPGSEAWLQMYGYTAPGDSETARKCAIKALKNSTSFSPSTLKDISKWLSKKKFSVYSFALSFGVDFVYYYFKCVLGL